MMGEDGSTRLLLKVRLGICGNKCLDAGIGPIDAIFYTHFHGIE